MALNDWMGIFGSDDEEDPNMTRRSTNPFLRNLGPNMYNLGQDVTEGYHNIFGGANEHVTEPGAYDPNTGMNEQERNRYMELSKEAAPSEGMYREYLGRRPDITSPEYKPKWWESLIGGLATMGGEGARRAGMALIGRRYNKAYGDWQTEGKILPNIARAADTAKGREIAAEKFGLTSKAAERRQSEIERKNLAAEKARQLKEEASAKKEEAREALTREREARAEAREARAEEASRRAEGREARLEAEGKEREGRAERKEKGEFEAKRTKALHTEEENIEEEVKEEIANDPAFKDYFATDKKGSIIITEAGKAAGIHEHIKNKIRQRKEIRRVGIPGYEVAIPGQ
jgi:hypothetical protein